MCHVRLCKYGWVICCNIGGLMGLGWIGGNSIWAIEKRAMVDVVVEKHVNALNESLVNFFRQGVSSNHGIGSPGTSISLMCQIYNAIDHISIIYPKIKDIKPKCDKCGLSHKT